MSERFPGTGRHDADAVATGEDGAHDGELAGPELIETKGRFELTLESFTWRSRIEVGGDST
jgi:hypothetical protein